VKRISKTEGWKKQTFFCCQKVNFDAKISLVFFAVTAINFMCIEHSAKLAKSISSRNKAHYIEKHFKVNISECLMSYNWLLIVFKLSFAFSTEGLFSQCQAQVQF